MLDNWAKKRTSDKNKKVYLKTTKIYRYGKRTHQQSQWQTKGNTKQSNAEHARMDFCTD